MAETEKDRTDRQLIELLNELRVVLPGAQILLAFLLTVPFATRFGRVSHGDRIALFVGLMTTVAGTVLLLAPTVYHRLRWGRGGKRDVVRVGNVCFLAGTAFLAIGIIAVLYLVSDVLFGTMVAVIAAVLVATLVASIWYLLPLQRGSRQEIEQEE